MMTRQAALPPETSDASAFACGWRRVGIAMRVCRPVLLTFLLLAATCARADAPADIIRLHEQAKRDAAAPSPEPYIPSPSLPLPAGTADITNFGSDDQPWLAKLRALRAGKREVFRIVILGDSHTACAHFGDSIRARLQRRLGDAGPGWMFPGKVRGQLVKAVDYETDRRVRTSRGESADFPDSSPFPLGGVVSVGEGYVTLAPTRGAGQDMTMRLIARRDNGTEPLVVRDGWGVKRFLPPPEIGEEIGENDKDNDAKNATGWQHLELKRCRPPLTLVDAFGFWLIGPVGLENGRPGVTVSAFGINGAQLSENRRWRRAWPDDLAFTQADLVILEYGNNEVYGKGEVDMAEIAAGWRRALTRIRRALPEAGILVVGAPESLRDPSAGSCGLRPPHLDRMQTLQRDLARHARAMHWPWQEAMGGPCSMRGWMASGLAIGDGVHFSEAGYQESGARLAEAILRLGQE